jgi:diguanylate cyclase (GGDEF)-like protein
MGGSRIGRLRLRIGAKFSLVLALLATCLLATALVGAHAQARMKTEADREYSENIVNMHRVAVLNATLAEAGWTALEMIPTANRSRLAQLRAALYDRLLPEVERQVAALQEDTETADEQKFASHMRAEWQSIKAFLTSPAFGATANGPTGEQADEQLAAQLITALNSAGAAMAEMNGAMAADARTAHARIDDEYRRSRNELALIVVGTLLAGIGSVLWLTHNVVPRIGAYSRFAADVAAGRLSARLHPTGSDELSDLGRTLNHMVERRAADHDYDTSQAALSTTLQGTESETEAHLLLKRHLERCLPGATAVVLNRNNSANRLQPTTPVPDDGGLAARLSTAAPRACLAVRFARPQAATAHHQALLTCAVCGDIGTASRCEPLIVGGEVIGSVLVRRPELSDQDDRCIRESVMHAAPVLANLRNLALAEHRALTDALTGLPNQRASHDTILRTTAHAARALNPLAVALLDLDHFKQINDLYGHEKGDEVLAAVGATLTASLRASDFAGRYGGEEFLLLLPDTGIGEAITIAERLRTALSALTIPGVDQPITASFGIAVLPDHATDAATLLRKADAALYTAKAAGRDRIQGAADVKDFPSRKIEPGHPEPAEMASDLHRDGRN